MYFCHSLIFKWNTTKLRLCEYTLDRFNRDCDCAAF
uniref:Uncharacterized protein n=1 Tax=Anguilla anguilla TaxID=7936 RepID=A0A0E9W628_ANGAN